MEFNEYQKISERTADTHDGEILNYALGVAGEAGEVADLIKKGVFHGHGVDDLELKSELGDLLWYISQLARCYEISLNDIAASNISKLKQRYPEGFSSERSMNREEKEWKQ